MTPSPDPRVFLADVTEDVLDELLALALNDTDADEITPPLGTAEGWNTERISWFREHHRAAEAGLDGPAARKTWALYSHGALAGSVRLRRTGPGSTALETGIWLARSLRGQGIGREALRQVKAQAARSGATVLEAETTAGNAGALALLRSAGAEIMMGADDGDATVPARARIPLR